MFYKTEGIILKQKNFGEADKIITIYTRDLGKIMTKAKGVRKSCSKLGGKIQPFYYIKLLLAKGMVFDTICEVEVKNHFLKLRNNLYKLASTLYSLEILDKLVEEEEKNKEIFNLLITFLNLMEKKQDVDLLILIFQISLISILGYRPHLDNCVICKEENIGEEIFFNVQERGVICANCRKTRTNNIFLLKESFNFLKESLNLGFKKLKPVELIVKDNLKKLLNVYINNISEIDLKSERFFHRLKKEFIV